MAEEGSGEDEDVTSADSTPTMVQMPTTPSMPAPDTVAPQADVRSGNEHTVLPAKPQQNQDQKPPEEENLKK